MNRQAMNANAFASTFYFYLSHNATTRKNKKSLQATARDKGTCTDKALNEECFGQPASKLQTNPRTLQAHVAAAQCQRATKAATRACNFRH